MRGFLYFFSVLALMLGMKSLHGQVMVTPTGKPSSMVICGPDGTFSFLIANTTGGTMNGATLTLDLPPSVRYSPGTISGATELNIANLNQPVFLLPGILNNTAHAVSYNAKLICGYTNTIDFTYIVSYNSSNYSGTDPPLQNFYFPSPVITSITNNAAVILVNSTVTRDITIIQQGLNASLDTLYLLDQHTTDIQVISTNLGTLHIDAGPGPLLVDTILLTGADFPGGNGKFDAGESIIISETVKLVGCTNGQSTLKAAWGCYAQICNFYSAFPSVSPAAGSPDIALAFTPNRKSWGFIDNSGFVEFTVTNNGSGAGGTVFDLTILSGFSSGGSTYYPNANWINKIDSFSVNGNYLLAGYNYGTGSLNGQYAFYTPLKFTFDPDGAGNGLADMDGDGFFDDLPVGKSFTIKAHTYYSWTQAVGTIPVGKNCGHGWTNSAWQGFRYGYHFTNQCKAPSGVNWVPNTNINQLMTYNTTSVQTTIPPDLYDLQPVWFEHSVNTSTAVNNDGCPFDSVVYKVVLPPGVIIANGYTATFKGVSMGIPVIIGDTAKYNLNKSRILSGGLFRVPVVAKCEIPHASTATIHAELKFWCDTKNYIDRYFTYWCDNSPLFGIQCPTGNCPDPSISSFNLQRKTMGWTDDRCTTRIATTKPGIRLDHGMSRDTIRLTAAGRLNGPVDSLFFKLKHNAIGGTWGNQLFFDYVADTLRFYDYETATWTVCTNLAPLISNGTTSVYSAYFGNLINPGGCLAGVTFSAGDSLFYIAYGKVKNIAQMEWRTIPGLRAEFYWKNQNIESFCNDKGASFSVLGSNLPLVASSSYQQIVIEGCNAFLYEASVYRNLDACGGDIGFPNEVRPYCVIDTMTFTLPEGFAYQAGSATHSYYLDNGSNKTENIGDPIITMGLTGTKLTFLRTPAWGFPDYYDCSNNYDRIRFYASPSCKATGNYNYPVDARGRYQYYADGQGVYKASNMSVAINYTPPLMNLNKLIGTAEGRQDTVMWKLSLCNARTFTAGKNWLGFENSSGGINIVSVKDVTIPGSPVTVPLSVYGIGKKWIQLGDFSASQCRFYEIRATYSICSYDSIRVRHGYNCSTYPVNPELGYPPSAYSCNENSTHLFLDPKQISLNLTVTSPVNPVNLCDTLDYQAEVTNSQLAYGYNLSLTLAVPPGLTIVPGYSRFRFPYSTGIWTTLSEPVNLPAGSNKWVFNISDDPNGISILKGVDSIPKNGYQLKFKVLTNCDFTSGKSIRVTGSASNACGDIDARTSYTQPIVIDGIPTNISLYVISTQIPGDLPTCSDSSLVKIKVINLGPNSVSSIEKIGINLDDAFDYSDNTLIGIHNGPLGIATNQVTGGIRYINFAIQPNLAVNDSIVFTFKLNDIDPGSLKCDTIPVETTTLLVAQVSCNTAPLGSCLIQSITSSVIANKPVVKDNVVFGGYISSSIPNGTTGETVTVQYRLKNAGSQVLNSTQLRVVFIHDANGNGLPDDTGSDSLHSQLIPVSTWLPGDSMTVSATFIVPANMVCNLLGSVRLKENACLCGDAILVVSKIHLVNAGNDISVCVNSSAQLGSQAVMGASYNWIPSLYLNSSIIADPGFNFTGLITQPTAFSYILLTSRPGDCISRDTVMVTVTPGAMAVAGPDTTVCPANPSLLSNSSASFYSSLHWNTSGTGSFSDPALLHPSYAPSSGDIGMGTVLLTLTANGSCGSAADQTLLSFQPLPLVTNSPLSDGICSGAAFSVQLSSNISGGTFSWTVTGSSNNVSGFQPGSGDQINQVLVNTGTQYETVTYHITPSANGCDGNMTDYVVSVAPVPDVYFSPGEQTICSGQSTAINILSHSPGVVFSWTAIPGSTNMSGYQDGTGNLISQTLLNSGSGTDSVKYYVTPVILGCPPGITQFIMVKIKPSPQVTNTITQFQQCSMGVTSISLQSNFPGSTFTWSATGSSGYLTGYLPGSGPVISQQLGNSGFNSEFATYVVTPFANGCNGIPADFVVRVFPVPDIVFTPGSQTICSRDNCIINLQSQVAGASFTWTASASSPSVSGYSPGSGAQINQMLINTGLPGKVTYFANPSANGCPGIGQSSVVTINPVPVVSQISCFDQVTTSNAKPFRLYGGRPVGGNYSGFGVSAGFFNPVLAGPGSHQVTYTYTNSYLCDESSNILINVLNFQFSCGNDLTDVRDGKTYQTSMIGGRCWMAENLSYGTVLDPSGVSQTDNCITEKYCLPFDPSCSIYGGLYQWDELIRYGNTSGNQGLCPPGWHLPAESEWQSLIDNISVGIPPPANGIAAGFLKDPFLNPGFKALPYGIYYLNNTWSFTANPISASMFWTSDAIGAERAVARGLNSNNASVSRYESSRGNAFSVRCVRDSP